MKRIVLLSLLVWVLLTITLSVVSVFQPGLDLAQAQDDYMGYWDYRLAFFLMVWVPFSLPAWALVTYAITKFTR